VFFRVAEYTLLAYVVYSLIAFVFLPDSILWAPKVAYRESLTGTFINRNTAATFFGTAAILWSCRAVSAFQSLRISSFRYLLLTEADEARAFRITVRLAAVLACFVAVVLTDSRGGLISSCAGLVISILLSINPREKARISQLGIFASAAFMVLIAVMARSGRIGSGGFFDEGRWSAYLACIKVIGQRPFFGTGLGTFGDVFPSLRGDDFPALGVWQYAHSTILEIAVEMGVPLAALIALAAVATLFVIARDATRARGRTRRVLAAVTGAAVLAYLHATIDFSLQIPGYSVVFGVLLGCGLGVACSCGRERGKEMRDDPAHVLFGSSARAA
jgi:O-antigen ligase